MTPTSPSPTPADTPDPGRALPASEQGDAVAPPEASASPPTTDAPEPPPGPPPPPAPDLDLFGNAPRHHPDWSHRRGEPRVLALIWTTFLTVITTTTLMQAAIGGRLDIGVYREGVRLMLAIILAAIVLAWPLVRLSQARPGEGGVLATFKDLLIVVVPLQAVLWPQAVLAHWPVPLVGAIDLLAIAWSLLVGAVIAWALGPGHRHGHTGDVRIGHARHDPAAPPPARGRALAMLVVVLALALGGLVVLLLEGILGPDAARRDATPWWRLLSPFTGLYELTADRAAFGETVRLTTAHLAGLLALGGVGVLAWLAAWAREIMARPSNPEPGVAPGTPAR